MIRFTYVLCILLVFAHSVSAAPGTAKINSNTAKSYERIIWDKLPIKLTLKPNHERAIQFPAPVRVKPQGDFDATKLRIQPVGDTLYLKAHDLFDESRLLVQALDTDSGQFEGGTVFVIDVLANNQGSIEPVQILLKKSSMSVDVNNDEAKEKSQHPTVDMVALVRYAAQQLYAPPRLIPVNHSIHRTPLKIQHLIPLYQGGEVETKPVASWKQGHLYVTAVTVKNRTSGMVILDPRLFRGSWRSRTLQHGTVERKDSGADTTTVYLVSERPFHESIVL